MKKHDNKHVRISLYVDAELYDKFMSYIRLTTDTASMVFERDMRRWLIDNNDYIQQVLIEKLQYDFPRGMS